MNIPHATKDTDGLIVFRYPKNRGTHPEPVEEISVLRLLMRPGNICIEMSESGLLVGRHTNADVRLSLPDISRRHCRFHYSDGQWEVIDLNSLNGIYVNGERLQQSVLADGDILRIANLQFQVEVLGTSEESLRSSQEKEDNAAVIQRIADGLPVQKTEATQEYRKAS